MTIGVKLDGYVNNERLDHIVHLHDQHRAMKTVAARFNPGGDKHMIVAKVLAAALIAHADDTEASVHFEASGKVDDDESDPDGAARRDEQMEAASRCAQLARAAFEQGAMWLVKSRASLANWE